jgi:hypothetical protein
VTKASRYSAPFPLRAGQVENSRSAERNSTSQHRGIGTPVITAGWTRKAAQHRFENGGQLPPPLAYSNASRHDVFQRRGDRRPDHHSRGSDQPLHSQGSGLSSACEQTFGRPQSLLETGCRVHEWGRGGLFWPGQARSGGDAPPTQTAGSSRPLTGCIPCQGHGHEALAATQS